MLYVAIANIHDMHVVIHVVHTLAKEYSQRCPSIVIHASQIMIWHLAVPH